MTSGPPAGTPGRGRHRSADTARELSQRPTTPPGSGQRIIDLTGADLVADQGTSSVGGEPSGSPPPDRAQLRGLRLVVVSDDLAAIGRLADQLHRARPDLVLEIARASTFAEDGGGFGPGDGDLVLVELDGLARSEVEAEETIRSLSAATPVVVLAVEVDEPRTLELLRAGASDVLTWGAVTTLEAARVVGLAAQHRRRSFERASDLVGQWLLLDLASSGNAGVGLSELLGMAARVLAEALSVSRVAVVELVGDAAVLRGSVGLPDEQLATVVATTHDGSWVADAVSRGTTDPVTVTETVGEGVTETVGETVGETVTETVGEGGDGSRWLVHAIEVGSHRWGLVGVALPANRDPTDRESAYLGQLTACLSGFIATSGSDAQLADRVRELTALRRIADASVGELTRQRLASEAADALLLGVRYPDAALAEVVLDGRSAIRSVGDEVVPVHRTESVDVVVRGEVRGRVGLAYRRPVLRPDEADGLLQPVARILSSWLQRTDADEGRRASDARNRLQAAALAATSSAAFITDASGRIEWVNDAFTDLSGHPAERAIGATPRLLWSGSQDAAVYEELWSTVSDGRVWRGQLVNRHADGHLYIVHQTITPVRDEDGRPTHFVAIQEEITERVKTQRELEAGRLRLQALFDTALDSIALSDDQGRYLDVNPAMERLTGYPRHDLLAMRWQDLAVSNLAGPDVAGPDMAGPDVAGPDVAGADVAGADVAGLDRAAPDLVAGSDLAAPDLVAGSDLAAPDLVAGPDLAAPGLVAADDLAAPGAVGEVAGRADGGADGPRRGGSEAGIFALRRKDRVVVETEYRAVADIQPGVHLSVLRDVTAHRAMVRQLADREERIRRLADNASDIVSQLTLDATSGWQVDYVNRAATELLGYTVQEFEDDPGLLAQLLDDPQQPGGPLAPLFSGEEHTVTITAQVARADGHRLWFEVNATAGESSAADPTVQLIARDVTARRQTLEALEKALHDQREAAEHLRSLSAMKDTFLQSVSHELRTPLTAIHGFASLLTGRAGEVSGDRARFFNERILANASRLHRLLDDLLDVDRVARGSAQPARTATDLAALVQRTIDEVDLAAHPIELHLEQVTLPVDAAWVERIVDNLIGNVVRHTPEATRIWIRLHRSDHGATLIVDDDGPGIPAHERRQVLEPFQQGRSAASAASPGTGMGLALVDSFARMHGGDVTLGESPWGGTRVSVTLVGA